MLLPGSGVVTSTMVWTAKQFQNRLCVFWATPENYEAKISSKIYVQNRIIELSFISDTKLSNIWINSIL